MHIPVELLHTFRWIGDVIRDMETEMPKGACVGQIAGGSPWEQHIRFPMSIPSWSPGAGHQ